MRGRGQGAQLDLDLRGALGERHRARLRLLAAQTQPLARGADLICAPGERVVALGPLREGGLRLCAPVHDGLQLRLDQLALSTQVPHLRLGRPQVYAPSAQRLARKRPAGFQQLALQALVQLGGLGLALERTQPAARLALDVERAIEVLLGALELQLRAAAALAVLAKARRLLDQQPPVAWLGGHDRLDPALGDDRVGLLAEARVGQHLEYIRQPAARPVQPVSALARTIEPAQNRDLTQRQIDRAVGIVEHDLHLRGAARLHAPSATEDHVLHRLSPDRQRGLLAHRPQDRVGHVGLARPVRPDYDADTGAEVQAGAVGERLEPLECQ